MFAHIPYIKAFQRTSMFAIHDHAIIMISGIAAGYCLQLAAKLAYNQMVFPYMYTILHGPLDDAIVEESIRYLSSMLWLWQFDGC